LQTYKLIPEAFKEIKQKMYLQSLKRIIVLMILFAVASIYLKSILGELHFIFISMVIVYFVFKILGDLYNIRRKKKEWISYILKIDNSSIVKCQFNQKEIKINLEDVSNIIDIPSTGLSIESSFENKLIFVPYALEEYEVLKEKLNQVHPIKTSHVKVKDPALTSIFAIQPLKSPFHILKKLLISFVIGIGTLFIIVVGALWFLSK
jgi:hypothetical protein